MLIKKFTPKLIVPEYVEGPPTLVAKVRGEVRAVLYDLNLRPVFDTGWTPNLITDYGLVRLTEGSAGGYMHIGTSSTPPAFTDLTLGAWVARTQASQVSPVNPVAPDYPFSIQKKGRYNPGVATGWVREMGISPSNTDNPATMSIRALLNPAVDKGIDNYLDVYHRLWHYPPLTPSAVTPLVLAFNGRTYNTQVGISAVTTSYYAHSSYDRHCLLSNTSVGSYGCNGIAEIQPPGLTDGSLNWTNSSGSDNTYPYGFGIVATGGSVPSPWCESEAYLGLDVANFTYGVGGINVGYEPHTCSAWLKFVDALTPETGIPKDNTRRFRFRARVVTERYTP